MKNKSAWTLRNIYLYLICFVTVIMILFGAVSTIRHLIDLIYPTPAYMQTEEIMMSDYARLSREGIYKDMTFEEYKKLREREWELQKKRERVYSVKRFAESLSMFIVAVPFYVYHWRKIEKEKIESGNEPKA